MPANYVPFDKNEWIRLEKKADHLRRYCLQTAVWGGSGHVGGSLSAMDCMTILYHRFMKIDPQNPDMKDRDRFVLSKGHCAVGYAPVLVDLGFMPESELKIFNLTGAKIGMHMDCNKVKGVDCSTGSLGHGLSIALGTGLAARVLGKDYKTYCILGDGECDEGSNWEAAMSINAFHATNVISFVDRNKCMIDGRTEDVMPLEPFADKWRAFGFHVFDIDGHNMMELSDAIDYALGEPDAPVMIIANTIKGEGIDFMEDDYHWHYGAVDEAKYKEAKESLKRHYEKRIARVEKEAK